MTTPTTTLASFFEGLKIDDIPADVLSAAAASFANVVGVAIGGLDEDATQRALAVARLLGAGGACARIIGTGTDATLDQAAFVSGVAAHVLDYDDTDLATIYHPSAALYGAVLALGEWRDIAGDAALLAWVVGLECGIRVSDALGMPHYDRGWHVTGTAGSVAAAAAGSRILGLTGEAHEAALNIGATAAGGHRAQFGTDTKSGHAGFAAQRGVHAVLLAQVGFTASPAGLTGSRGLLGVVGPDGPHGALIDGLGTTWRILGNRLKPYASGVVTHPAIDAGREIGDAIGRDIGSLVSVELVVHPLVGELTAIAEPETGLQGKFSVRHCFSVGLVRDKAGAAEFSDAAVHDAALVRARSLVTVRVDPEMPHMTARATARLQDGTTRVADINRARGSDARPLTDAEVLGKFGDLVAPRVGDAAAQRWFDRLSDLRSEASVSRLVSELDQSICR